MHPEIIKIMESYGIKVLSEEEHRELCEREEAEEAEDYEWEPADGARETRNKQIVYVIIYSLLRKQKPKKNSIQGAIFIRKIKNAATPC